MSDFGYDMGSRPSREFEHIDRPVSPPRRARDEYRSRSRSPPGRSNPDYRRADPYEDHVEDSNPGNQIYVRGLSFRTTEDELREVFDKYGELEEVNVVKDPHLNECRGFAFVKFIKPEDAEKAIQGEHDQQFHGRRLIVELSRRARPRPKTPGEYMGRLSSREVEARGGSDRRRGGRDYEPRYRYRSPDDRYADRRGPSRYDDDRRAPARYDDRDRYDERDRYDARDRRGYDDRPRYDDRRPEYDDRRGARY